MLDSEVFWESIDEIARRKELSLPRFALKANMDQSIFSRSRRKRSWMSLQTLVKALNAHNVSITEWARIVEEIDRHRREPPPRGIPMISQSSSG